MPTPTAVSTIRAAPPIAPAMITSGEGPCGITMVLVGSTMVLVVLVGSGMAVGCVQLGKINFLQ